MASRPLATIYIRDEVSISLEKIRSQFTKSAVNFSENMAYGLGRNFTSVFGLLGISSAFVSGGFVASISAMTVGISRFAQKTLTLNSTIARLNLTIGEYKQLVNIGIASGLSSDQAKADVEKFAQSVLDLRRGTDSDTRKRLEERGAAGSGTAVSRQLRAQLDKDGDRPYQNMLAILRQMRAGSTGSDADRLATEVWRESFGLGGPAWNQAIESIDEFGQDSFQPLEEDSVEFLLAQAETQRELENLRTDVGVAIMPALEKLTEAFAQFVTPEGLASFTAQVRSWANMLHDQPWNEIRKRVDVALGGIGQGFGRFINDSKRIVAASINIARIVAKWQKDTPDSGTTPLKFGSTTTEGGGYHISAEYKAWQLKNADALSGGESENIEDRRGGLSDTLMDLKGDSPHGSLSTQLGIGDIGAPANDNFARSSNLNKNEVWEGGPYLFSDRSELRRFEFGLNEMKREFDDLNSIVLDKVKTGKLAFGGSFGGGGASGSWGGSGRSSGDSGGSGSGAGSGSNAHDDAPQDPAGPVATPEAVTAVGGGAPSAFIMHHTSGRGTSEGVIETLRRRGLGVQYVMERDGTIRQIGGSGASHMKTGWGPLGKGLSNKNTVGMEVIARDDKDVTPAQVQSAKEFIQKHYPNTPLYGHGQVNPGDKEEDEGMTIIDAIKKDRKEKSGQRSSIDGAINGWKKDDATASLDIDVNVRGGRGTKVASKVSEGNLMSEDRISVAREIAA